MIKIDSSLPHIMTKFELGAEITPIQRKFLKTYGFLHFKNVASRDEVGAIISDLDTMEETWMCEGRTEINGIPLFMGETEDGKPYVQRFAFTTLIQRLFAPWFVTRVLSQLGHWSTKGLELVNVRTTVWL